jgi:hypothetical protein
MANTDARPVPKKNVAFRHYFAIRKNDGSLITTWAGQDTELSGDGGNFGDATSEATEIQTSGCGYIDLTSGEMNYDAVLVKTTVTNTDALPYVVVLFPEEAGDIRADATMIDSTAQRATDLAEIAQYLFANSATLTDIIADDAVIAKLLATDGDISEYDEATDALQTIREALEAMRDRGDAAWVTATSVTVSDKTGFKLASDGLDLQTAWTVNITGNLSGTVGTATALGADAIGASNIADDAFAAEHFAANALIAATFASDFLAAMQSEANDALVALNLDHLAKTATAGADMTTEITDNTILSRILANGDTSAFVPSTDGLQLIRDAIPTAAAIADAAWDEAYAGHNNAGSFGILVGGAFEEV